MKIIYLIIILTIVFGCQSLEKESKADIIESKPELIQKVSASDTLKQKTKLTVQKEQVTKTLRMDLEKYEGSYTIIEDNLGTVAVENLPSEITRLRTEQIETIQLEYLEKREEGYICLYTLKYENRGELIVSTLDSSFHTVDFRNYTNGTGTKENLLDTITVALFDINDIVLEQMHPNDDEAPEFSTNGIFREILVIEKNLTFKIKK